MEKAGILLQLLAGVVFGLDYVLPRPWLKRVNDVLSGALSFLSGKPGRASRLSLIGALCVASLAISLPMIIAIREESDVSLWGIIIGATFLVVLGGFAYIYALDLIIKRVSKIPMLVKGQKRAFSDKDLVVANSFLLAITVVLGSILFWGWFVLVKTLPTIGLLFIIVLVAIIIFYFLFPAFIGSLFYLTIRGFIAFLNKLGRMPRGALGPIALGFFILGGIFLLIEAW